VKPVFNKNQFAVWRGDTNNGADERAQAEPEKRTQKKFAFYDHVLRSALFWSK
jgi:hypothetical protein